MTLIERLWKEFPRIKWAIHPDTIHGEITFSVRVVNISKLDPDKIVELIRAEIQSYAEPNK